MKSYNRIKRLEEIVLPYKIVFPETIEGSVNNTSYYFEKDKESTLTYPQYEALMHSSYAKYLQN